MPERRRLHLQHRFCRTQSCAGTSQFMLKNQGIALVRGCQELASTTVGDRRKVGQGAGRNADGDRRMYDRQERQNRRLERTWRAGRIVVRSAGSRFRYLDMIERDVMTASAGDPRGMPAFFDTPSICG